MAKATVKDIEGIEYLCTGCGACISVCPTGALKMDRDAEGFDQPAVDEEKCIACGACVERCQVDNAPSVNEPIRVAGCYASDPAVRAAGSSGGIFGLLADTVLRQGGVVFGAVYDAATRSVVHKSTEEVDLARILRSKYAQSDAHRCYRDVRAMLKSGRRVLFCGTPCQVAGLSLYLGGMREGLLTVDFFCHGVPSPGMFSDYVRLKEAGRGTLVSDVTFREKEHGWREQHMRWYYADGTSEEEASLDNCQYFFFLHNYSLRKSCYGCDLYRRHASDVTLADYWLIDEESDDDLGTSLVLANTQKGEAALGSLKGTVVEVPVKGFDISVYRHGYATSKREELFSVLTGAGVEAACGDYYEKERAKMARMNRLRNAGRVALRATLRGARGLIADVRGRFGKSEAGR